MRVSSSGTLEDEPYDVPLLQPLRGTVTEPTDTLFAALHQAIEDRSIGREPYATTLEKLEPHTEQLLDLFKAWAPSVEDCLKRLEDRRADSILVMATADIVDASKGTLPDWFLPYLTLVPLGGRFLPTERALELLEGMDDEVLAHTIELTIKREYFARSIALGLILRIEDQATFERIVKFVASDESADKLEPVFSDAIDRVMPILRAKWKEHPTPNTIQLCLRLANRRSSPKDDDLYIDGLGHKLKGIREYAQVGLSNRGEDARALLERGVTARRKAVREWCTAQLQVLGQATDDSATEDRFASLSEEEQEAMGEKIDALYNAKKGAWTKWLNSDVKADPMLWLRATLALFAKNPDFIHRWQVFRVLCTAEQTAEHHEELWGVYLAHLAREPKLKSNHTRWHLEKHFALVPSEFEKEVFGKALLNATAPMSVPMYVHYFSSRFCEPALFVDALEHKSKKVRDAALERASIWPEDEDAGAVVALLAKRKKGTRQYAAEALELMPEESVRPHLESIATYTENEKVDDVKAALEAVLSKHANS